MPRSRVYHAAKPLFWQPQRAITCPLRRAKLCFAATTAPKIFAISLVTDKNSRHNFARLSAWCFRLGGTPTPEMKTYSKRTYKRICNFEDGFGAARRRPHRTPSLTICTSDCAMLLRSRRTKRGGITRGRYLSMRVLSVVPRASGCVGSLARGNAMGKTHEERGSCI